MKQLCPQVVRVPDGRHGCLTHRMGLKGCVEFGNRRILETYHLNALLFVQVQEPTPTKRRR